MRNIFFPHYLSGEPLFECDWEQNGNNLYIIKTAKY